MPKIVRSKTARRDLAEIWHYIALDNPGAADRLIDEIDRAIQLIRDNPGIGPSREELAVGLRSYPVRRYLILYRPFRGGVHISRVVHGARDLRALFED